MNEGVAPRGAGLEGWGQGVGSGGGGLGCAEGRYLRVGVREGLG